MLQTSPVSGISRKQTIDQVPWTNATASEDLIKSKTPLNGQLVN